MVYLVKTLLRQKIFQQLTMSLFLTVLLSILFLTTGCRRQDDRLSQEIFTVRKAPLDITVLASGNLTTRDSVIITQQVGRSAKILEIVEEGTVITQADIDEKRVLVKFDSRDLEDEVYSRQTALESAQSSELAAHEDLDVQESSNESAIRKAEQEVLFASNDMKKLVGDTLAALYLDEEPEDIAALLTDERLDGSALQDLTTYRSEIELAQTKLNRAVQTLEYTKKLYELQFVSKNDYENDQLEVQSQTKTLQATQGKYDLFMRFDFVKDFQKAWSTRREAVAALAREKRLAHIRYATAEAKYRAAQQTRIQAEKRLREAKESLAACTIVAATPGMVVYEAPPRWDNSGPIQVGKEINNGQIILRIPDLSHIRLKTNINESQIDALAVGQKAVIRVDALPGKVFNGVVATKAVLPSSTDAWLNPDLKVYEINLEFEDTVSALRPGMSGSAEIIVDQLAEVLYVPIQSIQTDAGGKHYCYLENGQRREVALGVRSRSYTVVTDGLHVGDRIQMVPPELQKEDSPRD